MKTILQLLFLSVICIFSGKLIAQSTIEISNHKALTDNTNWDRNPSITFYNGEYWLFYTKADNDGVRNVSGYDPDDEYYVVWFKHSVSISDLADAPETKLSLSESARPVGFDQRVTSAVTFSGSLYAFVSCGYSQTVHPVYYYKWDGTTWTGPTPLSTAGAAHVYAVSDGDRVYLAINSNPDNTDVYTWDGINLNGPYNAGTGNIVPKMTLKDGTLYVASIAEPDWTNIEVWSASASPTPTFSYLSTPYTATSSSTAWDPTIFTDGSVLYLVAAPRTGNAPQWMVQTYSTDNGSTWTTPKNISYGGYGSDYWSDFFPVGYYDGINKYLLFCTEGNGITYGDAEIAFIKMDWDLTNDHYLFIQNGIDRSNSGDIIQIAQGIYESFTISGKSNLTIKGDGDNTLVQPSTLINTGIDHKYDVNMSVSVFVNLSTNIILQNIKIEDNGVTPGGSNTPNAILFWNASTGTIDHCKIHGTYTISGNQTGQGIAVDAGSGQTSTLTVNETQIDGYQKNAIDAVDGNGSTGNPGTITINVVGGSISGAGPTSTIAQNGILFWDRGGGNVGGTVNGVTISNLEYTPAGTTASGIISSGDSVTISNTIFTNVQRYLASMGTGIITATDNNIFDGLNPSSATSSQLALLEDKIDHKMDDNATGLIIFKSGTVVATPNNLGIDQALIIASSGNTVVIGPGLYTPISTIYINKSDITIHGSGTSSTIIQTSQPIGYVFEITGAGTIFENLQIEKTDKTGVQNIILVNANNVTIRNNLIWGRYEMGDPDVSRALEVAGGLTGLNIEGNTIHSLRQPGYLNNSFGNITNNYVYGTRGWVIENGDYNFTANTWGADSLVNYLDIVILATVNPAYYPDIVAMSLMNNNANIEDQRPILGVLSIVYVDSSAATGGDGTVTKPYQNITPGLTRVVTGGTIYVAKGTYNEDVVIRKGLKLYSLSGRENTIVNGQLSGWSGGALRINASNVTVGAPGKGFTFISKTGGTSALLIAFYISAARDNLLIEENSFIAAPKDPGNNESYALLTEGGQSNHTYLNNIFDGMATPRFLVYINGYADVGLHSVNIDFIGNTFKSTAGGLSLSSEDGEISNNYFEGNAGIGLSQYATNTINGNYFQGVGNQVSLNILSGVNLNDVISTNTFLRKVVIKNGSAYRIETFPWGDFVILRGNIQQAIDAASPGDSVLVSDGTYEEQIEINKNILLHGESITGTIIKSPLTLTKYYTTTVNNFPVIYVHDIDQPEISTFTIDGAGRGNGNYRFQGIGFRNAGGTVTSCIIKDFCETPVNGNQHGVGIYAYADNGIGRTLHVKGDTIYGFQKNGTAFNGPNLTVIAENNVVTGGGAINFIAQNGLQIGFGATGSLINNNVSSVSYTPGTDVSCGLLLYQCSGSIQTINNTIVDAQVGIDFVNVGGVIRYNNITASAVNVKTNSFWGIIVDPGEIMKVNPQPIDLPAISDIKPLSEISSINLITTSVDSNILIGDGENGIGIEADALGTETLILSAIGNSVSNWKTGFIFYKEPDATLNSILRRNSIVGNKYGMLDQSGILQDARENWWGSPTGPADPKILPAIPNYNNLTGFGDSVSPYIDYNPWYIDPPMTKLSIYNLTINAANGSVNVNPPGGPYLHGTNVTLTPIPSSGYAFLNWTGDVPPGHDMDNPLVLLMDTDKNITANFAINIFSVSLNVIGEGTVVKNPEQDYYNYGSTVTLTAIPSDLSWKFSHWSGDLTGSSNPVELTIDGNKSITATFIRDTTYLIAYRTFTPESLALDRDNFGKLNKYVKRKSDKVEFVCDILNDEGEIKNDLHIHMYTNIFKNDPLYPLVVEPIPDEISLKNSLLEIHWNAGISPGMSVRIHGWGNKAKSSQISYAWSKYGGKGHHDRIAFAINRMQFPMPNRVNALYESFLRGGFNSTSGLVVGVTRVDSPKHYGWLQSAKYTDVMKTLIVKRNLTMHNGNPNALISYNNGKHLYKRLNLLPPTKHNNILIADMIALKLNIVASAMGITQRGFGELIYDDSTFISSIGISNILNLKTISEISSFADSMLMGYYSGREHLPYDQSIYDNLHWSISRINSAFEGLVDTLSFADSLVYKGVRLLVEIPYLRANPTSAPFKIVTSQLSYEMPENYMLYQNYPNPFNPSTTIEFDLPEQMKVTLKVHNIVGQEVARLLDAEDFEEGSHEIEFTPDNLSSGVYFYTIEAYSPDLNAISYTSTRKMILMK